MNDYKSIVECKTHIFDLDWNRHVTSRTYEKFSLEGRYKILEEKGFPIQKCIEEQLVLKPIFTKVQFLNQQYSGSILKIETNAKAYINGIINWDTIIYDENSKIVSKIQFISKSLDKDLNPFLFLEPSENSEFFLDEAFQDTIPDKKLETSFRVASTDLNCFWQYSAEYFWKLFEEGRWSFFNEVIKAKELAHTGDTSFFMGGKILYFKSPEINEKIKILSWIDSIDKIRFYFRQDILNEKEELLASMKDEQLFFNFFQKKPIKVPALFLERITGYYSKG